MKQITSKENPTFKKALKLTSRKYRDATGFFLLEGKKPLNDAIRLKLEIECIFIRESDAGGLPLLPDVTIALSDELFDRLSDTKNSQGIIAVIRKKIAGKDSLQGKSGSVIILDRLQDPGNVGTIVRTAEAAGMLGVITLPETADVYSPKVVRAAAGSLMRTPVIPMNDENEVARFLHEAGFKLVVTTLEDADDYRESELNNCGIVIGNEGQGVSDKFMALADKKVKIPMQGEIESINAAVAAGILMYAVGKVR